jgi:hypothetical protein
VVRNAGLGLANNRPLPSSSAPSSFDLLALTLALRLRRGLIHNKRVAHPSEVSPLAENESFSFADSIREARQHMAAGLRAQAEQIQKLNLELTELRLLHEQTEQEATRQWDELARAAVLAAAVAAEPQVSPDTALESVLGAVRALMTCTNPEQVFEVLTEEVSQWGVRAAIFDVRGKAAWGASAHGFGPALSAKVFRSLIVQLHQGNPFWQVCETAVHVEASAETLKKNRNVLDKLKPAPGAPILLLPIRSAGTVSAVFYADPGEKTQSLPVNGLKILAEFAGAQIDRLIALSGSSSDDGVEEEVVEAVQPEEPVEEAPGELPVEEPAPAEPPAAEPVPPEPPVEEPVVEEPVIGATAAEVHTEVEVVEPPVPGPEPPPPHVEVALEPPEPVAPVVESEPAPPAGEPTLEVVAPPPPVELPPPVPVAPSELPPSPAAPAGFDISQLSEAEQNVHRDAKRFARLLVSEIELYNRTKVADGRKNRDLYKRLKSDIDRSRQTFEKRFGKVLSNQIDYLHDELVKNLAANDSSVLGPEYPGPSA